jgi:7-carboxy-7-deazaguanine synthase
MPLVDIANFLIERNLNARLQVQLHKIVWDPDARGV